MFLEILRAEQDRFYASTNRVGDCVVWLGRGRTARFEVPNPGVGTPQRVAPERAAYMLAHATVLPDSTELQRGCDTPYCISPNHRLRVDRAENPVCTECQQARPVEQFKLVRGALPPTPVCHQCWSVVNSQTRADSAGTVAGYVRYVRNYTRQKAAEAGIPHELTTDGLRALWERQQGRCALTGLAMDLPELDREAEAPPTQASLARIDITKGYVPDNVRFVALAVSSAMRDWGLDAVMPVLTVLVHRHQQGAHTAA